MHINNVKLNYLIIMMISVQLRDFDFGRLKILKK